MPKACSVRTLSCSFSVPTYCEVSRVGRRAYVIQYVIGICMLWWCGWALAPAPASYVQEEFNSSESKNLKIQNSLNGNGS